MNTDLWSDSILHTREQTVTALLGVCRGYVQYYSSSSILSSSICQAERPPLGNNYPAYLRFTRQYREQCDTSMFGTLIKGLMGIGLFPLPANTSNIFMSVSSMVYKLSTIDCPALADRENAPSSHEKCKFGRTLCLNVDRLLELMPSAVCTSHRKHIEEQSKK